MLKTLNESDVGIAASSYEGFGFPLVEMIATGLPVIVSDKASLPELAGDAGLNFNSIVEKIEEALKSNIIFAKNKNKFSN